MSNKMYHSANVSTFLIATLNWVIYFVLGIDICPRNRMYHSARVSTFLIAALELGNLFCADTDKYL